MDEATPGKSPKAIKMENTVTTIEERIEENFKESARQIKGLNRKTFHMGGVHPEANKFAHSAPVETFPLPDEAVVYMTQHLGSPATPTRPSSI